MHTYIYTSTRVCNYLYLHHFSCGHLGIYELVSVPNWLKASKAHKKLLNLQGISDLFLILNFLKEFSEFIYLL